jgi:hypothetical protein
VLQPPRRVQWHQTLPQQHGHQPAHHAHVRHGCQRAHHGHGLHVVCRLPLLRPLPHHHHCHCWRRHLRLLLQPPLPLPSVRPCVPCAGPRRLLLLLLLLLLRAPLRAAAS